MTFAMTFSFLTNRPRPIASVAVSVEMGQFSIFRRIPPFPKTASRRTPRGGLELVRNSYARPFERDGTPP